jgi:hypothetical protein
MRSEQVVGRNVQPVHVVRAGSGFPAICRHGSPVWRHSHRHVLPAFAAGLVDTLSL